MASTQSTTRGTPLIRPKTESASLERWAVFLWRLPTGSSTPRVTVYRLLRRLGAATLTPGASLLPWREDLIEQLDWLAQEVDEQGGDAWVLQVSELSQAEKRRVVDEVNRCVRSGETETPIMTLADSGAIAATIDQARAAIGLRYPME